MSDTKRVQRWRDAKRQNGLHAVTVWLTTSEELRLKDAAVQERCSPSDVMQHAFAQYQARTPSSIGTVPDTSLLQVLIQDALAQWQPPIQSSISNNTDTLLIREMIREELAAMQARESPVTDTDTVTVTVTGALGEGATVVETATLESVTVTGNGNVTDTQAPREPGKPVPFKDQVLLVVTACGPVTCDAVADAVQDVKHKKTWRVLQELIAEGRLSKEGSRERTMYQVV